MNETATLTEPVFAYWTVTRAKNAGTKPNPHGGELVKWYCGFKSEDGAHDFGDVYWQRKAGSDVEVGDKVYGKIEDGQYGLRFKKEPVPDAPPGSANGNRREWRPEGQFDPEKVARIGRSHAQEMALRWCAVHGQTPEDQDGLLPLIDFFEADVNDAAAKAAQGAGVVGTGNGPKGSLSPVVDPGPAQRNDGGVSERISTLLEEAGVNSSAATAITNYLVSERSPQEQYTAIERLENPDLRQACVQRFSELTEKHTGVSLPVSDSPDEHIPF